MCVCVCLCNSDPFLKGLSILILSGQAVLWLRYYGPYGWAVSPVSPIRGAGWWVSGDLVSPSGMGFLESPNVGLSWDLGALK